MGLLLALIGGYFGAVSGYFYMWRATKGDKNIVAFFLEMVGMMTFAGIGGTIGGVIPAGALLSSYYHVSSPWSFLLMLI